MKLRLIFFTTVFVFLSALTLNAIWEALHVSLYGFGVFPQYQGMFENGYVPLWLSLSLIDAFYLIVFYFILALINRDFFWVVRWDIKDTVIIFLLGFLTALLMAYNIPSLASESGYRDWVINLPFDLSGFLPFFQLGVTALLSFWVTKRTFGFERGVF